MRLLIAVFLCKLAYFFGSKIGKGSSLPGKVALKLCPDALSRLKLPRIIIAVTGSNGKSSTAELIAHILQSTGMSTGWNREGSNQTEGIATLLLRKASPGGTVKCDALVLECDERYAPKIFAGVKPSVLLVTNLCRDQLTRNGHHEFVLDCLYEAVRIAKDGGAQLVLSADDPYTAVLGIDEDAAVSWFGVGCGAVQSSSVSGMYDDGAFCPRCKERMEYDYRTAAHFGGYRCNACGFTRPGADIEVTEFDTLSGEVTLGGTGTGHDGTRTRLAAPSLNSAYNLAAALAAAGMAGLDVKEAASSIDGYELSGGRTMHLPISKANVTLQICKHENSLAYNRCFEWITERGRECSVVIMVDSISRKYYTSETSWLWDIDFDILADECVNEIVLAGRYSGELMMRLLMSGVDLGKYCELKDTTMLRESIENFKTDDVDVITCFADKAKLLKELGIRN